METQRRTNPKVYLITSQVPTTATLSLGENAVTWEVLSESGQSTVIVPAGGKLTLSAPSALVSILPFKAALATGFASKGCPRCAVCSHRYCHADEAETPPAARLHNRA